MEIKRRGFLGTAIAAIFGGGAIAKSATQKFVAHPAITGSMASASPAVQNLWKPGMHMVPIESIRLNPMALRAVDKTCAAYKALVNSIMDQGVMHPVAMRNDGTLVDGAYRLEAAKDAGLTHMPANVMGFDTINNLNDALYRSNCTTTRTPIIEDVDDSEWEERVGWEDED